MFDKGPDRGPALLVLLCLFIFISIITTAIRLAVRRVRHQLGKDDLLISVTAVLAIVQSIVIVLQVCAGFGRHQDSLSEDQVRRVIKITWSAEVIFFFVLPLPKISIAFFIFRIKSRGWLRWCLYGLMAGLVLTHGLCIIILLAQCHPLHAYWDRTAGTCWNVSIYNDAIWIQIGKVIVRHPLARADKQTGFSILSDLTYSFLPIIILWDVQIAFRQKLAVSGLMSLGLMYCFFNHQKKQLLIFNSATGCAAVRAHLSIKNNDPADLTCEYHRFMLFSVILSSELWTGSLAIVTEWAT